jgi:hypothetical protein
VTFGIIDADGIFLNNYVLNMTSLMYWKSCYYIMLAPSSVNLVQKLVQRSREFDSIFPVAT